MFRKLLPVAVTGAFCLLSARTVNAQVTLTVASSTFAYPLCSSWSVEYHKVHPELQVNCQSVGSGGGILRVIAGTADLGGTERPMTDQQLAQARQKRSTDILHFPIAIGADVPTYNVPGVSAELNFTQEALAGIFLGRITKWNDPQIQNANPGVKLPNNDIVVIHRSDGSGTTYVWADYLAKISPEWKSTVGVGTSVGWPVGLASAGNTGVAKMVAQTTNSIGYVELTYAVQTHMTYGKVRNQAGVFVKADLDSVNAAAADVVKSMPADFRASITDASGKNSYPISSFTWLLIPKDVADKAKGSALKDFLTWGLNGGQNLSASLFYARVPQSIVTRELQAMNQLHY